MKIAHAPMADYSWQGAQALTTKLLGLAARVNWALSAVDAVVRRSRCFQCVFVLLLLRCSSSSSATAFVIIATVVAIVANPQATVLATRHPTSLHGIRFLLHRPSLVPLHALRWSVVYSTTHAGVFVSATFAISAIPVDFIVRASAAPFRIATAFFSASINPRAIISSFGVYPLPLIRLDAMTTTPPLSISITVI